jgi:hypothetical protein
MDIMHIMRPRERKKRTSPAAAASSRRRVGSWTTTANKATRAKR